MLTSNSINAIYKADERNALIVSDISIWEISMLINKGHIEIEVTAAAFINLSLQSRNVSIQFISPEIAELPVSFDDTMNKDPADRIIAATSIILNAQLVTADSNLRNNELLDTIW